ncbi:hypothetical protein RJD38_18875 [Vibrio scophthalmi]|uniref:Uncharacterized protein n=1 Tax=Vibrio scophthalmi TaxID=45658 RepID=A0A1C7FE55_9VIBR|nr:hypothetical protein [Vibrio scophthalmi]ANU38270.1 hypothetical protein VSVS05_03232 [Vibrio scophthalmi]
MTEIEKIIYTAAATIIGGLLIHSMSQLIQKLFIEPCHQYRQLTSKSISSLSFYSNMLNAKVRVDDGEDYRKRYFDGQDEVRKLMADMKAQYVTIFPLWIAIVFGLVPSKKKHKQIVSNMLTLSFFGSLSTHDDERSPYDLAKETVKLMGGDL